MNTFSSGLISKHRNALYGMAIVWILLLHSNNCGYKWRSVFSIFNIGNMGCEVFLFLSGICLYFSFYKNGDVLAFYKKRLIRIFLPVLLFCTWYWMLRIVVGEIGVGELVANFTLLKFWITGDQQIWFVSLIFMALHG